MSKSVDGREMLIIINGTVGVGKTSISKCLATKIASAVSIEGDCLGVASPDRFEDSHDHDYGLKVGLTLISDYRKKGFRVLIFDRFFENSQKLDWFISQVGLKTFVFYLSAREGELSNRIRKRARPGHGSEIFDSIRVQRNQHGMRNRGVEICTNDKTVEEVTAEIQKLLLLNS